MKKRIFLCTETAFPRGNAGANYIQYLALALIDKGWDVYVFGIGENDESNRINKKKYYEYQNIKYYNFKIETNRIKKYLDTNYRFGKIVSKHIKNEFMITKDDYFIFYTYLSSYINGVMNSFPEIDKSHFIVCCVEWLQPEQFKYGKLDRHYYKYQRTFNGAFIRSKKLIPISSLLDGHFREKNCKTLCLPIMADPFEYEYIDKTDQKNKIQFIYAGSANNKDSFEVMLESFSKLPKGVSENVTMHLTGISEKSLRDILGKKSYLIEDLRETLVIHKWMKYNELVALYQNIDFLLLARQNNISNRANFPSKIPEMMSYGIIPVCSNVGDYSDLYLTDGVDSIIFDGCESDVCAAAITKAVQLSKEKRLEMSKNSRKCVIDKFYYKNWGEKLDKFILEK